MADRGPLLAGELLQITASNYVFLLCSEVRSLRSLTVGAGLVRVAVAVSIFPPLPPLWIFLVGHNVLKNLGKISHHLLSFQLLE